MAGNCKILPAMLPVAVPVSIDGSSDAGGTIWRRKYRALKKKCEEFEQMNEVLCAQARRMHVMIERAEAEKRFLIKRLERYEVVEFPPKVPKLLSFDDTAIKAEVRSGMQKKEPRAMCPPPALLGPFPSSKPQQECNSAASSATLTTVSTVTQHTTMASTVLPQLISQASPKTKPSATTGTSAPKQKKTTKTAASGKGKKESTGSTRKRKSDADPLAPKKPSNAFFWFCQEYRPGLQEHFKGEGMAGQHDLTKILAKLWSETKMEDRKKYYDLYAEDKKRYDKAMEEYVKKQKLSADATGGGEGNTSKNIGTSQLPAN